MCKNICVCGKSPYNERISHLNILLQHTTLLDTANLIKDYMYLHAIINSRLYVWRFSKQLVSII